MGKQILKLIILLVLIAMQISVRGQLNVTLDSIEVTSTKIPGAIFTSGKSITVLNSKAIAQLPVASVDELLRYVAGVNVNARQGFGVQSDVGLRGSTFAQVLFVVDDIRINDPLTAHFNNNIPVALNEIATIEVVRGPAAAAYGADAVGGLIHIKTKTYLAKASKEINVQTNGEFGLGANKYGFSDIVLAYNDDKWYASASVKTNIADGEQLVNPNFEAGNSPDSLFNNYFNTKTYSAAISHFLNDESKIYARIGYDNRNFSAKYFYTASTFDESTEQINSLWTQIGFNRNSKANFTNVNIAFKTTNDLFVFNPLFTPNEHTTNQSIANAFHYYQFSDEIKLGGGIQFINKTINSSDRGNHSTDNMALFLNGQAKTIDNLTANLSVRGEYDTNFGFQVLPQLSAAYLLNNFVLRASSGKSIRAADFTERFVSSLIPNLSENRNIGNPDLKAETSWSFEIGGDYYALNILKASATAFYRLGNNLIDYITTNENDITNATNLEEDKNYFYPTNLNESNTFGLEIELQKQWQLTENLSLNGQLNYTFLNTSSNGEAPSKYIANHPTNNANLWFTLQYKQFQLSSLNNLISRDAAFSESLGIALKEKYLLSNFRFTYSFNNKIKPFLKIHNLFNTTYSDVLGSKMPARWWIIGVRF